MEKGGSAAGSWDEKPRRPANAGLHEKSDCVIFVEKSVIAWEERVCVTLWGMIGGLDDGFALFSEIEGEIGQ